MANRRPSQWFLAKGVLAGIGGSLFIVDTIDLHGGDPRPLEGWIGTALICAAIGAYIGVRRERRAAGISPEPAANRLSFGWQLLGVALIGYGLADYFTSQPDSLVRIHAVTVMVAGGLYFTGATLVDLYWNRAFRGAADSSVVESSSDAGT